MRSRGLDICLLEFSRCSTVDERPVDYKGFTTVGSSSGPSTSSWMITSCLKAIVRDDLIARTI